MECFFINSKAKGKHKVLVSIEDIDLFKKYSWSISSNGYLERRIGKNISYFHREILNLPIKVTDGVIVDHINLNKLDNRRENLRLSNKQLNAANMMPRNNRPYKGVGFIKRLNKFRSRIMVNYKEINLGLYKSELEAAIAYNKAAIKYFGEFAYLNKIPNMEMS